MSASQVLPASTSSAIRVAPRPRLGLADAEGSAIAGEGELAGVAMAAVLEHDAADGRGIEAGSHAVEDDLGHGGLAFLGFAARLEIDRLGEAAFFRIETVGRDAARDSRAGRPKRPPAVRLSRSPTCRLRRESRRRKKACWTLEFPRGTRRASRLARSARPRPPGAWSCRRGRRTARRRRRFLRSPGRLARPRPRNEKPNRDRARRPRLA